MENRTKSHTICTCSVHSLNSLFAATIIPINYGVEYQYFCYYVFTCQVSASGKAILITGCESPLAWCLARKLDELGFTIFAGFTKRSGCADADLLKEESSGRTKILQLDVTSETQVSFLFELY